MRRQRSKTIEGRRRRAGESSEDSDFPLDSDFFSGSDSAPAGVSGPCVASVSGGGVSAGSGWGSGSGGDGWSAARAAGGGWFVFGGRPGTGLGRGSSGFRRGRVICGFSLDFARSLGGAVSLGGVGGSLSMSGLLMSDGGGSGEDGVDSGDADSSVWRMRSLGFLRVGAGSFLLSGGGGGVVFCCGADCSVESEESAVFLRRDRRGFWGRLSSLLSESEEEFVLESVMVGEGKGLFADAGEGQALDHLQPFADAQGLSFS